jgi:ubiquitin-protein ligase
MLTSHQRRLGYEQDCLQQFMLESPNKLLGIQRIDDSKLLLSIAKMPALSSNPGEDWQANIAENHLVTLSFPRYYPAVPSEVFLAKPIFHPNVDPVNGFVCLWEKHRVANTVRNTLAKLAAVLAWRLMNTAAPHLMQLDALTWYQSSNEIQAKLPLSKYPWIATEMPEEMNQRPRRRRLS